MGNDKQLISKELHPPPIDQMFRRLDEGFTNFSGRLGDQIGQRTLLNVPERYWLYFQILNYLHGFCSIFLFVVGSICFCLGVQHSQYYTKVNCGDGAGLWPPIVNMIAAVAGQYAMRIIVYWPSFIHLILLVIAIPFTLLLLIDSAVAVPWWLQQPIITLPQTNEEEMTTTAVMSIINNLPTIRPKVIPTPVNIPQWKDAFAEMDLFLSVFAGVNLVLILCIMVFYIRWWFPIHIQRNNDQELR